jgi:hypothetical protein
VLGSLLGVLILFVGTYTALPRIADGLTITVTRAPNAMPPFGPSEIIFHRTYSGSTVGEVHDELRRLPRLGFNQVVGCGLDLESDAHYTDDLLFTWHGMPVQDYTTDNSGGCGFWSIHTLGVPDLTQAYTGRGTWQHLASLTGLPLFQDYQCHDCHLGPN